MRGGALAWERGRAGFKAPRGARGCASALCEHPPLLRGAARACSWMAVAMRKARPTKARPTRPALGRGGEGGGGVGGEGSAGCLLFGRDTEIRSGHTRTHASAQTCARTWRSASWRATPRPLPRPPRRGARPRPRPRAPSPGGAGVRRVRLRLAGSPRPGAQGRAAAPPPRTWCAPPLPPELTTACIAAPRNARQEQHTAPPLAPTQHIHTPPKALTHHRVHGGPQEREVGAVHGAADGGGHAVLEKVLCAAVGAGSEGGGVCA